LSKNILSAVKIFSLIFLTTPSKPLNSCKTFKCSLHVVFLDSSEGFYQLLDFRCFILALHSLNIIFLHNLINFHLLLFRFFLFLFSFNFSSLFLYFLYHIFYIIIILSLFLFYLSQIPFFKCFFTIYLLFIIIIIRREQTLLKIGPRQLVHATSCMSNEYVYLFCYWIIHWLLFICINIPNLFWFKLKAPSKLIIQPYS